MKPYFKILKLFISVLTLGCCTLFYGNAQAQGWCSDWKPECVGAIEQYGNANSTNNYGNGSDNSNSGGNSTPIVLPPRASQFGAVAWDIRRSIWGYSVLQPTQRAANLAAIADCGTRNCKVMDKFANTCIAMAWGGGRTQTESDVNQSVAEQKALSGCNAKGQNCSIILSECSLP